MHTSERIYWLRRNAEAASYNAKQTLHNNTLQYDIVALDQRFEEIVRHSLWNMQWHGQRLDRRA